MKARQQLRCITECVGIHSPSQPVGSSERSKDQGPCFALGHVVLSMLDLEDHHR